MTNEQMLFPYQNTSRQFKEMEMQGIPVAMANLAIHRQKEEEMNQERMRYDQILQEAAAQQARKANKSKARETESPRYTWGSHVIREQIEELAQLGQWIHVMRGKGGVVREPLCGEARFGRIPTLYVGDARHMWELKSHFQ
ncbi:hypothetical protein PIB30_048550 [Stylosanthes scabra]|uniref:Uncharacterized protein n=1 Tax=Stylosanthes scabra TaxID=79078 RepID=A0ABU6SGX0_9FABA|nr:hypothetical protein [Stylosanthes scabra]